MAGRQRSTFQKRQKEVKRLEAQRLKREKRAARSQERALNREPGADSELSAPVAEADSELSAPLSEAAEHE